MDNMLMKRRERARNGQIACHDSCDTRMAPLHVKGTRRWLKRRERQTWKSEVRRGR